MLLNVDFVKLAQLSGQQNVVLHLHGDVLRQDGEEQAFQFFVLLFHLQASFDAVSCVEEGVSPCLLHQVVCEEAHKVARRKDDHVGEDLWD